MAATQRIIITDKETVKKLNLMAAILETSAVQLATEAANTLWQEKQEQVMTELNNISPFSEHLSSENKLLTLDDIDVE